MNGPEEGAVEGIVKRARVYRYKKSRKLIVPISHGRGNCMVLAIADDLRSISSVTSRKFIKRELLEATRYEIETKESIIKQPEGIFCSYRFIRILTPEDTDLRRWSGNASLEHLPVSPEPIFTPEEWHWTGRREGNVGGGIALAIGTCTLLIGAVVVRDVASVLFALAACVSGYFLLRYPWKPRVSASAASVSTLVNYKAALRKKAALNYQAALTSVEASLLEKKTWDDLSPQHFEDALALRLKKLGYQVTTTRYSKDGGVDIEAVDADGCRAIVQAKKYAGNVGVAAVREMIGVRESRPDKPHAIIYSLNGFSRDAQALAERMNIELRDIRSELLSAPTMKQKT